MSLDPPIDGRSQQAEPDDLSEPALSQLTAERGAPLLDALEADHPGLLERADATGSYALATAVGLGFGREEAELCRQTARLTDIGLIYGGTDPFEAGAQLALGAGVPERVCDWIAQAAENYDGTGPHGLAGAAIPVFSRIVRAAKACDNFVEHGEQPAALRNLADSELDPAMVDALVSALGG